MVTRTRSRKLWVVYFKGDRRPRFPRAGQLFWRAVCAVRGHRWGPWATDDYEGPGEYLDDDPDSFMPFLSRPATDADEWAYRSCGRECGTVENRRPDPATGRTRTRRAPEPGGLAVSGTQFKRGERGGGMGGHSKPHDGASHEWYTPPHVFERLGLDFALDPCAPPLPAAAWIPAKKRISLPDDGLTASWRGRVFLNPPYGPHAAAWLRRLALHRDGVALVFARTETAWWHEVVPSAHAVCFLSGRLTFVNGDGTPAKFNAGAPSALLAWGEENATALDVSGLGMTFALRSQQLAGQGSLFEAAAR